jgi:hypothetical protein
MSTPAVALFRAATPSLRPTSLILKPFPDLAFYRSYDLPNRNTRHYALRISGPFPVTIDSRIGQVQTFHTRAL